MVRVRFVVSGREEQFENGLQRIAYESLRRRIQEKLAFVICDTHKQEPRVRGMGASVTEMEYEVFGCCDQMTARARTTLAAGLASPPPRLTPSNFPR
jgi:hypothetical protein